jgi:urocanate hydratase
MGTRIEGARRLRAPTGTALSCRSWPQEAALRCLMNNLDPDVAERPDELIVYGGRGRAARSWAAFDAITDTLRRLGDEETLLIQSGKPVAVFATHRLAPRVLLANSLLVPAWANWATFDDLEARGLMSFGQMTAGSWIYIGSQGIIQGTYETLSAIAEREWQGSLRRRLFVSAGLGGMGGAQPLAAKMLEATGLFAEVDPARIERRLRTGYLDEAMEDPERAVRRAVAAREVGEAVSIGVNCHANDLLAAVRAAGVVPDLLSDQTSAHDPRVGYIPDGMDVAQAAEARQRDPQGYLEAVRRSMARHVEQILDLKRRGAQAFEYGNNLRRQAADAGAADAFEIPGYVPFSIRDLFAQGKGPFRWLALSGDPEDIRRLDRVVLEMFPDDRSLCRWIRLAGEHIHFQGLPARIGYLGFGQREAFGLRVNAMVRSGELRAPIVFGRDHHDTGSVASPYRETEAMKDGSDAVADWPILNALLNVASGAHWVSVHHGGGVGMGYSLHAGMVVVADGSAEAEERLARVLHHDAGIGVVRHADAGYERAVATLEAHPVDTPLLGPTYPPGVRPPER